MARDLKVFMHMSSTGSGDYYRVWQPFDYLAEKRSGIELSLIATLASDYIDAADVFVLRGPVTRETFDFARSAKQAGKRVVLDVDQMFEVPPYSPRFSEHARSMPFPHLVAGLADHLIVASPRLAEVMSAHNERVSVVRSWAPPGMRDDENRRALRDEHGIPESGVVIAWTGHPENAHQLHQIADALSWVACARETVHVLFFGEGHDGLFVPEGKKTVLELSPFRRYLSALDMVDIGVCPLDSSLASQCNPGHQVLEFGAKGIPVVAAAVGTMSDLASAGTPIVAASSPDEWKASLLELIDSAELRQEQSRALEAHVRSPDMARESAAELVRVWSGDGRSSTARGAEASA